MPVYPSVLPATAKAFSCLSKKAFNPKSDILLSVEYSISGNVNTEAGLSFFITTNGSIAGGLSGIDLCYSGNKAGSNAGVSGAMLGLGIDSTGAFGLSATGRDGVSENNIIPNSVALRGPTSSSYALSTFNTYVSLSNLSGGYSIIHPTSTLRSLRFRLGNIGRTVYLDHRNHHDEVYTQIASFYIGDYFDLEEFYRVGFGLTTSVSSNNPNTVANFNVRRVHVEGLINQLSGLTPLVAVWENVLPLWPEVVESWSL